MDQLRPWIAREIQAAVPSGGSSSSDNGARGSERAQLVVDLVEALLKSHDVDNQEGYCTVKEQVCMSTVCKYIDGHFLACGTSTVFHLECGSIGAACRYKCIYLPIVSSPRPGCSASNSSSHPPSPSTVFPRRKHHQSGDTGFVTNSSWATMVATYTDGAEIFVFCVEWIYCGCLSVGFEAIYAVGFFLAFACFSSLVSCFFVLCVFFVRVSSVPCVCPSICPSAGQEDAQNMPAVFSHLSHPFFPCEHQAPKQ